MAFDAYFAWGMWGGADGVWAVCDSGLVSRQYSVLVEVVLALRRGGMEVRFVGGDVKFGSLTGGLSLPVVVFFDGLEVHVEVADQDCELLVMELVCFRLCC